MRSNVLIQDEAANAGGFLTSCMSPHFLSSTTTLLAYEEIMAPATAATEAARMHTNKCGDEPYEYNCRDLILACC